MTNDKLNFVEASFLVVIVMITHIISDLPNDIIKAMGSASILNMIFISAIILLFFLIVAKIFCFYFKYDFYFCNNPFVFSYCGKNFFLL